MSPPPRPPVTASSSTPETAKPSRAASSPPVSAPITIATRSTAAGTCSASAAITSTRSILAHPPERPCWPTWPLGGVGRAGLRPCWPTWPEVGASAGGGELPVVGGPDRGVVRGHGRLPALLLAQDRAVEPGVGDGERVDQR